MMDYYKILGVGKKATVEEIKKAHRRRSRETHPDKAVAGDYDAHRDNAEEFRRVQRAYHLLSDAAARQRYDETGDDAEVKSEDNLALEMLAGMALDLVAQDAPENLVEKMRQLVRRDQENIMAQKANTLRMANKFRRAAKRFRRKAGEEGNVFVMALERKAEQLEAATKKCDLDLALTNKMLELLEGYEYVVNGGAPLGFSYGGTSVFEQLMAGQI
jgi:DnaJ-class molecular chaperone